MGNKFNKEEVVLFENVLKKFDSDNTVARRVSKFQEPGKEMQRRGDTVWRPSAMISTTVDGLDVSALIGSITQLSVPATLSTISNVTFELDAKEMRDEDYMLRKAESASQALSAKINRVMANNVLTWGSLVVPVSTALSGYDDISLCDALMTENDIMSTEKTMVLNARDHHLMAGNLASRTLQNRSEQALSEAFVGRIAKFDTFETSFSPSLTAKAAGAVTVNGAQRYVPEATSVAATGEESNVDNRAMNLTVSTTATTKAGDRFTIGSAGTLVKAVSHINKNDTLQAKTFTVVEVVDGTTLKIAPPIIVGDGTSDAEDDYANCSQAAANSATLNFLNTVDKVTNIFFENSSLEVFSGRLAFDDMPGVDVTRMTTDSGLEIIFAKQGNAKTGKTFYRLLIFFGVTNLNPELNGILLGGQT